MSIRQIDTDIVTFLHAMELNPSADSMAMVDIESNIIAGGPRTKSGGLREDYHGRYRIFDFGYGFFNPLRGTKGEIKSNLVYEGMINPKVANQILSWKKVRDAAADHHYSLFNQLKAHNWWSDRAMSQAQIEENITTEVVQNTMMKKYDEMNTMLLEQYRVLGVWQGDRSHWKESGMRIMQRSKDISTSLSTLAHFDRWIQEAGNLEALINSEVFTGHSTYDGIMRGIYDQIYSEHSEAHSKKHFESDMQIMREIELKMGTNFADNVERWGPLINRFHKDLEGNGDLLAITGYNIQHEQKAIQQMNEDFGVSSDTGDLTRDQYRIICMNNMLGLMKNQEAWKILKGVEFFSGGVVEDSFKKALSSAGSLVTSNFEALYKHTFDAKEYEQTHTAKGDVSDQMDVFNKAVAEYLEEFLSERKGVK